jgi:hypothetical protein
MRWPTTEKLVEKTPQLRVVGVVGKSHPLQPRPQLMFDVLPAVVADATQRVFALPARHIIKQRDRPVCLRRRDQ